MRFRKERMAGVIQEVVSEAISRRLNDPRNVALTTVTRVEVSGDLMVAKVFLSIPGDASAEHRMMAAVRHAAGFLQHLVADALSVRQCPEVRFFVDEAVKNARVTLDLLAKNRRDNPELFAPETSASSGAQDPGGDES